MESLSNLALRAVLVLVFLGCLVSQFLVPVLAQEMGGQYQETVGLVRPYSVVAILAIGAVQVALLVIWRLLFMVESDRVFSTAALRWVNALTGFLPLAALLASLAPLHLLFVVGVGGPGVLLLAAGLLIGALALLLLMLVMRGLLVAATRDRVELDMVV